MKIAVLDFKAGVGVQDVDGMSSTLITYLFDTQKFTIVERTQVNRVISEQGFQLSSLTENQMVKIGEILNVQKIVVGDVNIINGQYNVDVRILDVQTATMNSGAGEAWAGSLYRTAMQKVAQTLTSKMQFPTNTTSPSSLQGTTLPNAGKVVTIYGYLQVYPTDLGDFSTEPQNVIAGINNTAGYGYNDWRLPTTEELEAMQSNIKEIGGMQSGTYMTTGKSYSYPVHIRLVTNGKTIAEKNVEQKAAEQKAAEQRAAEQRVAEQRAAEQRAAEQRAAEQRAAEQRAAEQRAACDLYFMSATGETLEKPIIFKESLSATNCDCPSDWRPPTLEELQCLTTSFPQLAQYEFILRTEVTYTSNIATNYRLITAGKKYNNLWEERVYGGLGVNYKNGIDNTAIEMRDPQNSSVCFRRLCVKSR